MQSDYRDPNCKSATFLQSVNPVWWAGDVDRPLPVYEKGKLVSGATWWQWFGRNPFANFKSVILGCSDCFRTVYWKYGEGWTYAPKGWNWGGCRPKGYYIILRFISYRGWWPLGWLNKICKKVPLEIETAVGWETSGGFTTSFRRANSPNAGKTL